MNTGGEVKDSMKDSAAVHYLATGVVTPEPRCLRYLNVLEAHRAGHLGPGGGGLGCVGPP